MIFFAGIVFGMSGSGMQDAKILYDTTYEEQIEQLELLVIHIPVYLYLKLINLPTHTWC